MWSRPNTYGLLSEREGEIVESSTTKQDFIEPDGVYKEIKGESVVVCERVSKFSITLSELNVLDTGL